MKKNKIYSQIIKNLSEDKKNLVLIAITEGIKFESEYGKLNVEDLFNIELEVLDRIYKNVSKQLKENEEDSLLTEQNENVDKLRFARDVVKVIFEIRKEYIDYVKKAEDIKRQKEEIMRILEAKKAEQLKQADIEELERKLAELEQML